MDTRAAVFVVSDAAFFKQLSKGAMDCAVTQAARPQINEQR